MNFTIHHYVDRDGNACASVTTADGAYYPSLERLPFRGKTTIVEALQCVCSNRAEYRALALKCWGYVP